MSKIGIKHQISMEDGKVIELETGKLAKQADGSVVLKVGNLMLLATICSDQEAGENVDFLPLTVEYKENFSAAGKYPGGFFKRETRPSNHEILVCRLIDRALRPMFPDDYHANTVIQVSLISSEKNINPDSYACLAASAAIAVSNIPFNGPVSEVRIGRVNGQFIINPTISQTEESDLDMVVAGNIKDICMVEGEMKEISEDDMASAIMKAHEAIKIQCQAIIDFGNKIEKAKTKRTYSHEKSDLELYEAIKKATYEKCKDIARQGLADKHKRAELFKGVIAEFVATLTPEEAKEKAYLIKFYYHKVEKDAMRHVLVDDRIRLDGRKTDEIRPIWSEVDYLPSTHGSAIFTRGETQSLTTVTLGTKMDEQTIDGVVFEGSDKFMLNYNFPPFSTGEARPPRGTSRREVGHGNLAMRALKNMIPADCAYTIRVVSDILESNGSSSMATVCAGSLALMDAGVKIIKPVTGIAMGLINEPNGKYAVLSDILGDEDHLGDMDFKVCGTKDGITACQMDLKIDGLSYDVLKEALEQAKRGRLHILNEITQTMSTPREDYKPHAPRIVTLEILKEFIGAVIGPGGKVIQEIQKVTGAVIHIEEKNERGIVEVSADNKESLDAAVNRIKAIVAVPEVGGTYEGKVKNIMPFGAFVEFMPGKDGLLHISEISWARLETMDGVFKEGDVVKVKLMEVDRQGKFKLSRKALMPRPERKPDAKPEENQN
ncbi:MAG: polyribonucleotide nucleotidyltransferase [Bacteroidota bacterium]